MGTCSSRIVTLLVRTRLEKNGTVYAVTALIGNDAQTCSSSPTAWPVIESFTFVVALSSPTRSFVTHTRALVASATVVGLLGGVTGVPLMVHDGAVVRSLTTPRRAASRVPLRRLA